MRRFLGNIVSLIISFFKLCFLKLFHFKSLKFYAIERFSPNVVIILHRKSNIQFGKRISIHSFSSIEVNNNAQMLIGSNVKVNTGCKFVCRERIEIGEGTEFGPNVLIYDHDHDFRVPGGIKTRQYKTTPVIIGKNVWVGAGSIILRGTRIGDNAVIAAGSIVKQDVPSNTIFIQKLESTYSSIK